MAELCTICGKDMVRKSQDYRFTQCGLQNVALVNWEGFDCDDCQRFTPIQPTKDEYEKVLVKALLTKPSLLSGEEICFLRHAVGGKGQQFAVAVGIMSGRYSRLEKNEERICRVEDCQIRRTILEKFRPKFTKAEAKVISTVIDTFCWEHLLGFRISLIKKEGSEELESQIYYSN